MRVKFEQRVPVPADSVAVRCGEGEVTIEVKQNFLGNGCRNWSVVGVFFAGCWGHFTCLLLCSLDVWKQRVKLEAWIGKLNGTVKMGHSVLITPNGTDYALGDQYYVSSYFFTLRRGILLSQMLSLQRRIKKPFYLSCGWTCTCCECYWLDQEKEMASGNGLDLSCAFSSLFLGNRQLIHPSDLTLGGCATLDTADHILQFQTELQGCGSTMRVCGFLSPLLSLFSCVF